MFTSAFFNSKNSDRVYKADDLADYFASFIGNGVFPNPSSRLQVQEGDGMKITVRMGKAWINGYFFSNKSDYVITLDGADGVLGRIDRVVVRWSLPDRAITLERKKGSISATPAAPVLRRDADIYELALADIAVKAGVVKVTQADITDLRLNKELCGIVTGTVDEIDTSTLFNQFESWFAEYRATQSEEFSEWFSTVKEILDENTAARLLSIIEDKQDKITANGLLKSDGQNNISAALPDIDYVIPGKPPLVLLGKMKLYVDAKKGSNSNDGKTEQTAFNTISRAVEELGKYENPRLGTKSSSIEICIAEGEYPENVFVFNNPFDLFFVGTASQESLVKIKEIRSFYSTGNLSIQKLQASGFYLLSNNNAWIYSCIISDSHTGINVNSSRVKINRCTFSNLDTAISANSTSLVYSDNNKSEGGITYGLKAQTGIIFKFGTQPDANYPETKAFGGQIFG